MLKYAPRNDGQIEGIPPMIFARRFIALLALTGFAAYAASNTVDLATLSVVGDVEWRFDEGMAEAGPQEAIGYLVSTDKYSDFRLTVEFWIEDDTNSGIFLRCVDAETISADACYEANIWDNHPNQESRTGSIVKHVKPQAHVETIGEWNTYDIEVRGNTVQLLVNETLTATLQDDRLKTGYVALQYGGKGRLRFRNLEITPL
jgi:hypothetical protein